MNKPEFQDYDLTEEEIVFYKSQLDKYNKRKEEIDKYNKELEKSRDKVLETIFEICFFGGLPITLLYFFLFFNFEGTGGFILSVIFSGITLLVICLIFKANTNAYTNDFKQIDYNNYIPVKLDKKVTAYKNDLIEYNEIKEKSKLDFWKNLSPQKFEQEVAKLFEKFGYETQVTSYVKDGGVDIILEKDGLTIAVQCKHYKHHVGVEHVRSFRGILEEYDGGIFVTLNGYTKTVWEENKKFGKEIKLLTAQNLVDLYKKAGEEIVKIQKIKN